MGYIEELRAVVGTRRLILTGVREIWEETGLHIGNLQLIQVFSGKDFFTKLPNGDEYFHDTIAYATKDIRCGILIPDGIETEKVDIFKPSFFRTD